MKLKLIKHNHLRTIQQVRPNKFTFPKDVLKVYSKIDNSLSFWWQTTNYSQFWNLYTVLSLYRTLVARVASIAVFHGTLQPLSKKKIALLFSSLFQTIVHLFCRIQDGRSVCLLRYLLYFNKNSQLDCYMNCCRGMGLLQQLVT